MWKVCITISVTQNEVSNCEIKSIPTYLLISQPWWVFKPQQSSTQVPSHCLAINELDKIFQCDSSRVANPWNELDAMTVAVDTVEKFNRNLSELVGTRILKNL